MSIISSGYSLTTRGGAITARGGWDPTKVYFQDDVVIWNSVEWQSLVPRNINNQPDTSPTIWVATSTLFVGSAQYVITTGGSPKFQIPPGIQLIHSDSAANWFMGMNALVPPTPTPGTLHQALPDFAWYQNSLRLFLASGITVGALDDPADVYVRRAGPVGGFPYGGGNGTATCTKGSVDVPVTHTDPQHITNFLTMPYPRNVLCVGGVPIGTQVLSVTSVDANNVIVHLDTPASATGSFTLYVIGTYQDLCGLDTGTTIGQYIFGPFIVPFQGDANTRGAADATSSGALAARTVEMARQITPNQDNALGTEMRLSVIRIGRGSRDDSVAWNHDGGMRVGLGAVNNPDGALTQVRGAPGTNEKQIVTITGATSGTFLLRVFPDPTTIAPSSYGSSTPTGAIPFNAPLDNNDGGVSHADLRYFLADAIRLALTGAPNAPATTAIAYSELKLTGGPNVNSQPFTIEFGGQPGSTTMNNRNFTRIGADASSLLPQIPPAATVTVAKSVEGIPSDQSRTWFEILEPVGGASALSVTKNGVIIPAINALRPSGIVAETYDHRFGNSNAAATLASGTLRLIAIYLTAGQVISNIAFISGSVPAGTPTHQWFALYTSAAAPVLLGQTTDDLANAWAANSVKTLPMTPFTIVTSGLYLLGIMVAATTTPNLTGIATPSILNLLPPITNGNSTAGLTTTAPNPAAAISGSGSAGNPYAQVT